MAEPAAPHPLCWDRVAERAFGLLLALERAPLAGGGTVAERFRLADTSRWHFVRDAFFEREGGILDTVAREERGALPADVGASAPDAPPPGRLALAERARSLQAALESLGRIVLGRARAGGGADPVLIVTPHGSAAAATPSPYDHWSVRFAAEWPALAPTRWVSLFPPQRHGAWAATWLADLAAVGHGAYVPWQAGLAPSDLLRHARARAACHEQLARVWADAGWQAALAAGVGGAAGPRLEAAFLGLARDLALAETLCRAARRVVSATRPRAVVTFDAGNAGRAFTWAARRAGIPTVGIQTGIISPAGLTNLGYRRDLAAADAPWPDRLLVWGPYYVELLTRFGWDPDALVVGGFPEPVTRAPAAPNAPRTRRPGPPRLLVLAVANLSVCSAVARPEDELALMEALLAATQAPPGQAAAVDLAIRCHPSLMGTEYAAALRRVVARFPHARLDDSSQPLATALARADAVLGGGTTALVEAARADRPIGLVATSGLEVTGFSRFGVPVLYPGDDPGPVLARVLAATPDDAERRRRLVAAVAPDPPAAAPLQRVLGTAGGTRLTAVNHGARLVR